jgi:nucleoside-diphosphate-sugar epimerase
MTRIQALQPRDLPPPDAPDDAPPDSPAPADEQDPLGELSPSRYIARVSARTGAEVRRPIDPEELLVHAHRDQHPFEVALQFLASRAIGLTASEARVRAGVKRINEFGATLASYAGSLAGTPVAERVARKLMGVVERHSYFKFREPSHLSEKDVQARVHRLQREARAALRARGRNPKLHVLLTGATGFLGKELLSQMAADPNLAQVTAVVRPETLRDPKTREVVRVLSPAQRGALLLKRLHLTGARARKFRFIAGDIEQPALGVAPGELERLRQSLTHVIHCAASVSFDDTYESSYRANVRGCLNALEFSLAVQNAPGNAFVHHIAIETSYIHGRTRLSMAQEGALVFPRHFYNNFYELTKAMASIETDRFMIEKGLRVAQLLPSIVIGVSRTGNNRGDTKVVNAPINAFGRAKDQLAQMGGGLRARVKARLIGAVANGFPGDPSAELNLVPVDRVAQGILAALSVPEAIGARVHLATDNRIRTEDVVRITREELGVNLRLADPTLFRNFTLPVVKGVLERAGEHRIASALEKLGTIFGSYGEWGQPVHEIGNDVRLLGLAIRRPDTLHAFRMLCRHNRYVQEYGRVRDPDEIARRERLWEEVLEGMELRTGHEAASIPPEDFRRRLAAALDPKAFRRRGAAGGRKRTGRQADA